MAARRFALCVRGFCSSSNTNAVAPNPNPSRVNLLDTLRLAKDLEQRGLSFKEAEVISRVMVEVMGRSLDKLSVNFVYKTEFHNNVKLQDSLVSTFGSEIRSAQDKHIQKLQYENSIHRLKIQQEHSLLKDNLEKLYNDLCIEMEHDKGELSAQIQTGSHEMHAQLEAATLDVIKYCLGTIVSMSAVGVAVIRFWF